MEHKELGKILAEDPSLIWYTKDDAVVDNESILEHILNYGTWNQVQKAIKILGLNRTAALYQTLVNKPRSNIKQRVKHYFDLYFTHALRSTN
ncbi:hypothetical protein KKG63_02960 [Patescibacteria group bacterium]|nr:hypothetical protein [Patescibacteria group bacterium]